jgi:hypothetical protein
MNKVNNIKQVERFRAKELLTSLNRLTQLTWGKYPNSLLPSGLVIYGNNYQHTKICIECPTEPSC